MNISQTLLMTPRYPGNYSDPTDGTQRTVDITVAESWSPACRNRAAWVLMLAGLGGLGWALRTRRTVRPALAAG